jgi:ankyrin repeat protein
MTAVCFNILAFEARAVCCLDEMLLTSSIHDILMGSEWKNLLSDIEKTEIKINEYAQRKSFGDILGIYPRIDALEKNINDTIDKQFSEVKIQIQQGMSERDSKAYEFQFLNLLYINACPYKESKNRNAKHIEGTCNWFTNHPKFNNWNSSALATATNLLYVSADPGCGKSVLARYLIEEVLLRDDRTICYFFFKDDFDDQKSALRAVCTLLHQLFVSRPELLTDAILHRQRAQGKDFFKSFTELWDLFVEVASHKETVCVIDALDECLIDEMKQLVRKITGAQVSNLKFLLTSRPYDHIRAEIFRERRLSIERIHLQGSDGPTAEEIVEEIKLVVKSRIEETVRFFSLEPDEQDLMQTQFDAVPNRTYLWVSLVFDGLMGEDTKHDTSRGLRKSEILDLTRKLPQSVDAAYEKLLNKHPSREKERRRALHLVLGAKRPLSLAEMSVALAFENREQSNTEIAGKIITPAKRKVYLKNLCGLFISIINEKVYLLHQTAREFLDPQSSGRAFKKSIPTEPPISSTEQVANHTPAYVWKHSMDKPAYESTIAETCIRYLHSAFRNKNDSLLEYSAIYWIEHYNQSRQMCQEVLAKMTQDLCLQTKANTQWITDHRKHKNIPIAGSPLRLASALGLGRAVKLFLRDPSFDLENEVDSKDEYGRTPLLWAARNGHGAVVEQLLATGKVDIDSKDDAFGRTPLSWAAMNGFDAVVKQLLATGKVEIDSKDVNSQTPLSWATENGHGAVVEQLLATGKVDIDLKDDAFGRTPLLWAARNGHDAVVKQLLATGKVNIDLKDDEFGQTPLSWAARNGHDTVVKQLLATGKVDIDLKDDGDRRTPLSWAAGNGHDAVVKQLLATGKVDIDSKDDRNSQTPLLWAARNGHDAVVKQLLATGKVDINSKDDRDSQTPLSWAAGNGHGAVVEQLLATGKVDIDSKDDAFGRTPLSWAAEDGHDTVVKQLLATGKVDIDSKDVNSRTPLSWAAMNGHDAVVKQLLATGKVDIDSKDDEFGQTPLLWAATNGYDTVVEQLQSVKD